MATLSKQEAIQKFGKIADKIIAMSEGKIPPRVKPFLIAQMALESNWGTSRLAQEDGNYGGLTTPEDRGAEYRQDVGSASWKTFRDDDDYAQYAYNAFFRHYDFSNVYTLEDFNNLMYKNSYFTEESDLASYNNNMPAILHDMPGYENYNPMTAGAINPLKQLDVQKAHGNRYAGVNLYHNETNVGDDGAGFWERTSDSFEKAWDENASVAYYHAKMDEMDLKDRDKGFDKQKEDYKKRLAEAFPGDEYTQNWIMYTAVSEEHFERLLDRKMHDKRLAQKVDKRDFGMHSIIGAGGAMVLDPVNIAGIVVEYAGAKAGAMVLEKMASRLGSEMVGKLGLNTASRVALLAGTNGFVNVGEQYFAKKYGVGETNYALAFAVGAGSIVGIELLRNFNLSGKAVRGIVNQLEYSKERALMMAGDIYKLPYDIKLTGDLAKSDLSIPEILNKALKDPDGDIGKKLYKDITSAEGNKMTSKEFKDWLHNVNNVHGYALKGKNGKSVDIPLDKLDDVHDLMKAGVKGGRKMKVKKNSTGHKSVADSAFFKLRRILKDIDPNIKVSDFITHHPKSFKEELVATLEPILKHERGIKEFKGYRMKGHPHSPGEIYLKKGVLQKYGITPEQFTSNPKQVLKENPEFAEEIFAQARKRAERQGRTEPYTGADFIEGFTFKGEKTVPLEEVYKEVGKDMLSEPKYAKGDPMGDRFIKEGVYWDGLRKATKFLETNTLTGTKYGVLRNSKSKSLRELGDMLLADPIQRDASNALEHNIRALQNKPQRIMGDYIKSYEKWCCKEQLCNPQNMEKKAMFNRMVADVFEGKFEGKPSKAITEAVDAVKRFREHDLKVALGAGIIDTDKFDGAMELYRRVDPLKLRTKYVEFETEANFKQALKEYALATIRRDKLKEGEIVEDVADEWAQYIVDSARPSKTVSADKSAKHWLRRIPMDTAQTVKTSKGVINFDDMLRDYDLLRIMDSVSNHTSVETAFRWNNIQDYGEFITRKYDVVEKELEDAVNRGEMSAGQMKKELKTLREAWTELTHTAIKPDDLVQEKEVADYVTNTLKAMAYATHGQNMWVMQYLEGLGTISTVGGREMMANTPGVGKFLGFLRRPREHTPEQMDIFKKTVLAYDLLQDELFMPTLNSRELLAREGSKLKQGLGHVEDFANKSAMITSQINQMSRLTNNQVLNTKASIFGNLMHWAKGDYASTFAKSAFNEERFAVAGITDVKAFKKEISERLLNLDESPDALRKAIDKWELEDRAGAMKLFAFLDVSSRRAMIQHTVGGSNLHKGVMGLPVLHQFKEFSRMAIHSHLLRALHTPSLDDFHMMWTGAIGGTMGIAFKTYVYAHAKYDDPVERQQYLDENLSVERLLRASLVQNSFLAGTSYMNDIYESMTGATSIRYTLYNDNPKPVNDAGSFVGNIVNQTPSGQVATDMYMSFRGLLDYINHEKLNGREERALRNLFPVDKNIYWQTCISILNALGEEENNAEL